MIAIVDRLYVCVIMLVHHKMELEVDGLSRNIAVGGEEEWKSDLCRKQLRYATNTRDFADCLVVKPASGNAIHYLMIL